MTTWQLAGPSSVFLQAEVEISNGHGRADFSLHCDLNTSIIIIICLPSVKISTTSSIVFHLVLHHWLLVNITYSSSTWVFHWRGSQKQKAVLWFFCMRSLQFVALLQSVILFNLYLCLEKTSRSIIADMHIIYSWFLNNSKDVEAAT